MTYSLWAYGPSVDGAKTSLMMITIPLVIMGIFRYLMLGVNKINKNKLDCNSSILETPENIIIYDKPIQIIVFVWLLSVVIIGFIY